MKLGKMTIALLVVAAMASATAHAALSEDAAAATAGAPLYLPANPADPGGLKGYDHGAQLEVNVEAHEPKSKQNKAEKDKTKPVSKKAVTGPKVAAGSYTPAAAPEAGSN